MGVLRSRGRVERTRGGGIDATTSRRTRDFCGGGESNGDGNGDGGGKCRAPLSRNLGVTALVLAAEAAAALIADDADGGNSSVAIVGRASLAVGGGLINYFHRLFVVDIIIFTSSFGRGAQSTTQGSIFNS